MKRILLIVLVFSITVNVYSQALVQKLDEIITAYADNNKFNGVALVAKNGEVIFHKGYGLKNVEANQKHNGDAIFQIGSITKQITAAVIMQLQEEGKLSVKDPLSKYFKGFQNADKITVEHLLTHTSGIYNYTNDTVLMKSDVTQPRSRNEMVSLFTSYKPDFAPGEKYNYSNSAYSLLGYIIQDIEKKPYEQVVRERIFKPLGMTNSGFDFTNLKSNEKAVGYFSINGKIKAPIVDSTIAYSAGAIYSTAQDLLKWERGLSTGKVLKEASVKSTFTPFKSKYGYGWNIDTSYGTTFHAHSGGIHGFTSYILRFPETGHVIILLDNGSTSGLGKIARTLAAAVFNKPYTVPEKQKQLTLTNDILKQYLGEYQFGPTFSITVTLDGNQLKAQATGQDAFEIFPEKENLFYLKVVEAKVEFVKDSEGKVTEMILYQNGMTPRGKKIK